MGEPLFVPSPEATKEDDGWLLCQIVDATGPHSDLVILDARDLSAGPVARLRSPVRLPFSFHGSWTEAEAQAQVKLFQAQFKT